MVLETTPCQGRDAASIKMKSRQDGIGGVVANRNHPDRINDGWVGNEPIWEPCNFSQLDFLRREIDTNEVERSLRDPLSSERSIKGLAPFTVIEKPCATSDENRVPSIGLTLERAVADPRDFLDDLVFGMKSERDEVIYADEDNLISVCRETGDGTLINFD